MNEPSIYIASNSAFTLAVPKYRCAKHGLTSGCVSLWGEGQQPEGEYCMECYKDWVRTNLLPVVRESAAPGESKEGK